MTQRSLVDATVLRQVSLFQSLDDDQLAQLRVLLKERSYRKGQIIFHHGDPGGCLYLIVSGRVRIYLTSPDGREATVCVFGAASAFGEFSVLDGESRSASAIALDPVITLVLFREDFMALLRKNFPMVEQVFALLTHRLRYSTASLEQLAFLSMHGRVAAVLLQLASVEAENRGHARLELTQQELASFVNTTREWINRALRDFAERGLVRVERGAVIVLDRAGLERMIQ